jgi:hypothetical protein
MTKLTEDIEEIKCEWSKKFGSHSKTLDETKPAFGPIVEDLYERFQAIRPAKHKPAEDTPLTRLLLSSWNGRPELSNWALLRASVLFASYSKWHVSSFVWWMSGIQLCHLKAMKQGITVAVTPQQVCELSTNTLPPLQTFCKYALADLERIVRNAEA